MLKDFIANFYELWQAAYLGQFSDQMYENDFYLSIAIWSVLVGLALTIVYYFVIDRPKTAKLSIWLLNLLVGSVICAIIAYVSSNNDLTELYASAGVALPTGFSSDMVILSFINGMWTIILMTLFSLIIKWKSPNSSFVPF